MAKQVKKTSAEITEKAINEITKTEKLILTYNEMEESITEPDEAGRLSKKKAINNKTIAFAA